MLVECWCDRFEIPIYHKILNIVGHGGEGIVYEVDDNRVLKIFILKRDTPLRKELFENACKWSKRMSDEGIGPIFYDSWMKECKNLSQQNKADVGFILMEKMDHSLNKILGTSLLFNNKNLVLLELRKLLERMMRLSIMHGDLANGNIMLNFENGILSKLKLIDFVRTEECHYESNYVNNKISNVERDINIFGIQK